VSNVKAGDLDQRQARSITIQVAPELTESVDRFVIDDLNVAGATWAAILAGRNDAAAISADRSSVDERSFREVDLEVNRLVRTL
jgi:hypothetical protein